MELFASFGIDAGYVIIGMMCFIILIFILLIISLVKIRSINIKYEQFMKGEDGKSLEKSILDKFDAIQFLENNIKEINRQICDINNDLKKLYRKIALVRYDAFKEPGGKLSFVLVLLTDENNGFILNSMHTSREGCYVYTKEVINGETFVILSEEEQQALNEAINNVWITSTTLH